MGLEEEYKGISDEKLQEKLNYWDTYTEYEQEILSREIARRKGVESKTEESTKKRTVNKLVLGIIMVVVILGLGIVGYYKVKSKLKPNMPMSEVQAKKMVLEKLEKRYDEEFAVKSFRYVRYTKAYEMDVYPVENKNVVFKARMHPMDNYSVSAGYIRTQWFIEASEYIKPFGNKISKKNITFANIHPGEDNSDFFERSIDNKWKFKHIIDNYVDRTKLYITIYVFKDLTEENKDEILESIYQLVQFIKKEGFKTASIEIEFYDEEYFRDKDVVELYNDKRYSFDDRYNGYISKMLFIDSGEVFHRNAVLFSKVESKEEIEKAIFNWPSYYKNKGGK